MHHNQKPESSNIHKFLMGSRRRHDRFFGTYNTTLVGGLRGTSKLGHNVLEIDREDCCGLSRLRARQYKANATREKETCFVRSLGWSRTGGLNIIHCGQQEAEGHYDNSFGSCHRDLQGMFEGKGFVLRGIKVLAHEPRHGCSLIDVGKR